MSEKLVGLTRMKRGEHGVVREIDGGQGMLERLSQLGIRKGRRLAKVSSMVLRGPVVVSIHNRHVAIGYGMAKRIMVEIK